MFSVSKLTQISFSRVVLGGVYRAVVAVQVKGAKSGAFESLPEKPKRPPSPWLLFLAERRNELQEDAQYEEMTLMEMSKKIGEEWRNFDELDKIPYKEKYEESLNVYKNKMESYKSSLTPEDKRLLRKAKFENKHDLREFEKELPKPKYPGNGYIMFVKACSEDSPRHEEQDAKDWIKECASKWQNLDEETKQRYNEEALHSFREYKEDLKDWKEKYQEWKKSDSYKN